MFKKIIFLLLIQVVILYANDTAVKGAGGTLRIKEEKVGISIENEIITVNLYQDHYKIIVRYNFLNLGEQKEIKTGFPDYKYGTQKTSPIRNFRIYYGNGNEIQTEYNSSTEELNDYLKILGWYSKTILFKEKMITTIQLEYEADYGIYGYSDSVEYLLGTGRTWDDSIDNLTIRIINNADLWIDNVKIGRREKILYDYHYIADGIYEISAKNYEPNIDDTFTITFSKAPLYENTGRGISDRRFLLKDADFTEQNLYFLSRNQLKILRNSIFAYRGYSFKSEYLNDFFNDTYWYTPISNFSESIFTDTEKANIQLIRNLESILRN